MKAVILSAGLGTRLRPLTLRWPKPGLPVMGQPLLRYSLRILRQAGVDAIGINTHHLPEEMAAIAQTECDRLSMRLTVVHEPVIQGTGGGIRGLRSFLEGEEDFVVFNGDILFGFDLAPVLAAHRDSGATATMLLLPMPPGESYAAVETTCEGDVRRIAGKGPGGDPLEGWHFTGVHVMSQAVLAAMSPAGEEDINRQVYLRLIEAGAVIRGAVLNPSCVYWSDLGTPRRFLATHRDLLFGHSAMAAFAEDLPMPEGSRVFVHPSAKVNGAELLGPAFVGAGAVLESGVRLGSGVSIGPGARVGKGASLVQTVVLDGAEVAAGAQLEDCLVVAPQEGGPSVVVPAH